MFEWIICIKGAAARLKTDLQDKAEKEIPDDKQIDKKSSIEEESGCLMDENRMVKAGTIGQLVEMLTSNTYLDMEYMVAFLLTYQSFMTPEDLLNRIISRYDVEIMEHWSPQKKEEFQLKSQKQIRLRVINVLKHWISNHYKDLHENELIPRLVSFLQELSDVKDLAKNLVNLIEKKKIAIQINKELQLVNKPLPIIPKTSNPRLIDIDPMEISRQIALIEQGFYKAIRPRECLNQRWNSKTKEIDAPNILAMIHRFNYFSRYVTGEIVKLHKLKDRQKLVERFIIIAIKCREINNYNGLMAIIAGLEDSAVHRLYKTWEIVNDNLKKTYESLRQLMSSTQNYKQFRLSLHIANPPCIPYMGVYLTDLTFIEDGMPDKFQGDLINFVKRKKISVVIREIQQYQQTPYALDSVECIQYFLKEVTKPEGTLPTNQSYQMSLNVEPRSKK